MICEVRNKSGDIPINVAPQSRVWGIVRPKITCVFMFVFLAGRNDLMASVLLVLATNFN